MDQRMKSMFSSLFRLLGQAPSQTRDASRGWPTRARMDVDALDIHGLLLDDLTPDDERGEW